LVQKDFLENKWIATGMKPTFIVTCNKLQHMLHTPSYFAFRISQVRHASP